MNKIKDRMLMASEGGGFGDELYVIESEGGGGVYV